MNAATKTLTISAFVSLLLLVGPAIALAGEPNPAPPGDIITVPDAVGFPAPITDENDPDNYYVPPDEQPLPDGGDILPAGAVDQPAGALPGDAADPGSSGQGDPGAAGYQGELSPVADDSGGTPQEPVDSPAAVGSSLNGSSAGASDGQAVNSLAAGDEVSPGDDAAGLPSSGTETLPETIVILILAAIILAAVTALVIFIRRFRAGGVRLS